ncbi:hypothetical protein [Pseudoxanthomonas mexicana]|uniref:hypothetical protein n=1 Tax=Pseudoxanthomonas mexicana TaxID=128785 RepID=UPI00398B6BB5
MQDARSAPPPSSAAADAPAAALPPPQPAAESFAPAEAWVIRIWRLLLREPSLLVAATYLSVSFIGLWASFWFYRSFSLPILEYMQPSDYLVAGLRDPAYALLLAASVLLVLLITWPEVFRIRYPGKVQRLRGRWWGRLLFPELRLMRWAGIGMAPITGTVVAGAWGMIWASSWYVIDRAEHIREGGSGHRVQVTMIGDSAPLPQQARLLGTTSAYVFLWWPAERRAEAIPLSALKRMAVIAPSKPPVAAAAAVGNTAK